MKFQLFAATIALSLSVQSAMATEQSHAFDISLFGIRAGVMRVTLKDTGSGYTAQGRLATKGILSKLARLEFDGVVSGQISKGDLSPRKYSATIARKKSASKVRISYANRVPKLLEYSPTRAPRDTDVDASLQRGAVDLVSATFMIVRDVSKDELCNKAVQIYDGRRRSKIQFGAPKLVKKTATCAGAYSRIAGFSTRDLEKGVRFPFTAYYEMQDDETYRLMRVSTKSTVGSAWLRRRN